ncbi:DUF4865 family protein [Streptosporangium brasiliense]|uniref:DUF4865 domain-containing protein n=2 Tax=Streptosporangium TaxID=2000 RepID=A0ABT9RL65_9ACTN|nr:DUF4865 family protein [Streptosporangium brasiliense]MDP9869828.1 hypothetical protein [Streptosporangium brasiliense]
MYAMQYEITLPADYDMDVIRRRVATRGSALDAFPGLGLKAFVIRERGSGGSPVNQYAPFYLWAGIGGMNRFLWGGAGFGGIVDDFGRPEVRHWTGVALERGPAHGAVPRAATRRTEPIPAGADPAPVVERALGEFRRQARAEGVHTGALAVDPRSWELVHFTLWEHAAPETADTRYEVLHLSAPHLADIGTGRQW